MLNADNVVSYTIIPSTAVRAFFCPVVIRESNKLPVVEESSTRADKEDGAKEAD